MGPYAKLKLLAADGQETTVKTLTNALIAEIAAAPHAFIGRRVVISYAELTPTGKFRHGIFDHFAGPAAIDRRPHPTRPCRVDRIGVSTSGVSLSRPMADALTWSLGGMWTTSERHETMKHRATRKAATRAASTTANTTAAPTKTPAPLKASGRQGVDWQAAGRKAWATRLSNAAAGAPSTATSATPQPAPASIGSPATDGPATA